MTRTSRIDTASPRGPPPRRRGQQHYCSLGLFKSEGNKAKYGSKLKDVSVKRHVKAAPTQGGPVLTDQPAVVDEERRQADREHGGREEEEEDVELGLRVREAVLQVRRGAGQRSAKEQSGEELGSQEGPSTGAVARGSTEGF